MLDINMDDGLIEGVGAMTRFVNLLVADPETSRVPFMIDSSKVCARGCYQRGIPPKHRGLLSKKRRILKFHRSCNPLLVKKSKLNIIGSEKGHAIGPLILAEFKI